ncbi:hypothetical protein IU433_24205 [Nocardia puris]|uniref:Uncharacterized protein n=1 Tax=Nocardia puris TaxID=208602 RepID=A0A366DH54_9NOCA|nr:hypothetical protein [Nocardia puris]MBF6213238.1 hypothetical protein [Nocardia puris]MBF6369830.1 hypothetical protein [Nocardia puris]MBF6462117.1 hypothetical protein [Nocardia puris]RBO89420.1 hypothetical protein DFR74_10798 [Nocardia puris]
MNEHDETTLFSHVPTPPEPYTATARDHHRPTFLSPRTDEAKQGAR